MENRLKNKFPETLSEFLKIRQYNFRAANKQIKKLLTEVSNLKTAISRKQYYENRLIITNAPESQITANRSALANDQTRLEKLFETVEKLSAKIQQQNDLKKSFNPQRYIVYKLDQWWGTYNSLSMVKRIKNHKQKPSRPLNVSLHNKIYPWDK